MQKLILFFFVCFLSVSTYAVNEITVKDNNLHGSKPGFIENATLVIEPHGGYVEQSLYLEYSERNQFTSNLLEIVHRFELSKDAVVKDMWLWIGDSVMQARMYDTWSARKIYDSIVAAHYDPAFLTKNGNQYEFRIYPLAAGSYRKVKINFIVPTKWLGNMATAELPIKMLLANNSTKKPLNVLFRTKQDIWGVPKILEIPEFNFEPLTDTIGYKFQHIHIEDISNYTSLNLKFNTQFNEGYYISGYNDKSNSTYFQLGVLPNKFFEVSNIDTTSKDILIAMDFSGSLNKDLYNSINNYKTLVDSSLKNNDRFKMIISGDGKIVDFTESYIEAKPENIEKTFDEFKQSDLAASINNIYKPNILFCDEDAFENWKFPGLSSVANFNQYYNIYNSMDDITKSDIVAAYRHGYDAPIDQISAGKIIDRLDSLFANGGRFVTYYDYNRVNNEKLATHYIKGLKVKKRINSAVTLYRNTEGNIGRYFPESITRNASYFLESEDPDVKIELMDQFGDAAVISKKIKGGLIVVTGMWSLRDDEGIKSLLSPPLLGVNSNKYPFVLDKLLEVIKNEYEVNNFKKVILLSDSDSLINTTDSKINIQNYIGKYSNDHPKFYTLNLLNNNIFTPQYISENQMEYYGSGYFLKELAEQSQGIHLEKHMNDWLYISSVFSPYSFPLFTNMNIKVTVDGGLGQLSEIREINEFSDPNKPRFFLGRSNAKYNMKFNISGRFENNDLDSEEEFEFLIPHDTTSSNEIVSKMLGFEHINDIMNASPIDTSEIVKLSLYHNLLTDFTALLALEPNDTIKFMRNPFDESELTYVDDFTQKQDSVLLSVYPNPFNSQVVIKFQVNSQSIISASIYNALGQLVYGFNERIPSNGIQTFVWNCKNNYGVNVSSGFYIFNIIVIDQITQKKKSYSHKLLHLK